MEELTWKIRIHSLLFRIWQNSLTLYLLYPLSLIYRTIVSVNQYFKSPVKFKTKTIVIGNPVLGGAGKTPFVIELAKIMTNENKKVGIVTKGYLRPEKSCKSYLSTINNEYRFLGDEGLLIANKTGLPVAAGPSRVASVNLLLSHHELDVILFDDGLSSQQVYFDCKIALFGDISQHGNGSYLPSGPLRHHLSFYNQCDLLINQAYTSASNFSFKKMTSPVLFNGRKSDVTRHLNTFTSCYCVTGIANPSSLINFLRKEVDVSVKLVADHQTIPVKVLEQLCNTKPVIMTEKDWVKIYNDNRYEHLLSRIWIAHVMIEISNPIKEAIIDSIK